MTPTRQEALASALEVLIVPPSPLPTQYTAGWNDAIRAALGAIVPEDAVVDEKTLAGAIHDHRQCDFGYCDGPADHEDEARGLAEAYRSVARLRAAQGDQT